MKIQDVMSKIALVEGKNLSEHIVNVKNVIDCLADLSVKNPEVLDVVLQYGKKRLVKKRNVDFSMLDKEGY
jgi:hypothetical protein